VQLIAVAPVDAALSVAAARLLLLLLLILQVGPHGAQFQRLKELKTLV